MLSEGGKIRVMFSKTGALKFISHLDLNRTVKAAFLRSGLPIWYTMGFNPHPKVVFSLPLSVGTASLCEFMDFKITRAIEAEEVCAHLNAAFPAGLRALRAYEPSSRFSDIGWAQYEIVFESPGASSEAEEEVRALFAAPMMVEKSTKAGVRELDIAPLCKLANCRAEADKLTLSLLLCSDEKNFVNPRYPIELLQKRIAALPQDGDYTVCRTAVFLADGQTPFA